MQQFINGQKVEVHLCQQCAFKIDNPEMLVSLENVFKGFLDQLNTQYFPQDVPQNKVKSPCAHAHTKACIRCGMTFNKFKTGARLGCEVCYKSFKHEVEVLLKNVQGSTRHEGKYPRRMGADILSRRQIIDLRSQLKKAVEAEDFEDAARLRDEIRSLESAETGMENLQTLDMNDDHLRKED